LNAIALLSAQDLQQPLTIHPQASTENAEVLFCNMYQGDRQIFAPYDDQTDWKRVSRAAIDGVKAVHEE
jgi:hypothetical protein